MEATIDLFSRKDPNKSKIVIVLVYSGCHNRTPQTGWLTQQKFIFSQSWRLEIQDQGAIGVGF